MVRNDKKSGDAGKIVVAGPLREGTTDLVVIGEFTLPAPIAPAAAPIAPTPAKPGKAALPGKAAARKPVPGIPTIRRELKN
jgi:hypothetical protein